MHFVYMKKAYACTFFSLENKVNAGEFEVTLLEKNYSFYLSFIVYITACTWHSKIMQKDVSEQKKKKESKLSKLNEESGRKMLNYFFEVFQRRGYTG